MNEIRIDVKGKKIFEELTIFLTFHQFSFKIGEEKIFDVEKLAEVKKQIILIENNKIEEFKVLYCIFKNLKANSGIIEDKNAKEKRLLGEEVDLYLAKEELVLTDIEKLEKAKEEESPFKFRKEEEEKNKDKPLEEVFYKKKDRKKVKKKERSTCFKMFLLLFWIIVVIILTLIFVLIR